MLTVYATNRTVALNLMPYPGRFEGWILPGETPAKVSARARLRPDTGPPIVS